MKVRVKIHKEKQTAEKKQFVCLCRWNKENIKSLRRRDHLQTRQDEKQITKMSRCQKKEEIECEDWIENLNTAEENKQEQKQRLCWVESSKRCSSSLNEPGAQLHLSCFKLLTLFGFTQQLVLRLTEPRTVDSFRRFRSERSSKEEVMPTRSSDDWSSWTELNLFSRSDVSLHLFQELAVEFPRLARRLSIMLEEPGAASSEGGTRLRGGSSLC